MRFHAWVGCLLLLSATPARETRAQVSSPPLLALRPCVAPATHQAAQCGTIALPENRARAGGRQVHLAVLVQPATDAQAKLEPIVFLHGGPGIAATHADDYVAFALGPERKRHDLVMVDMRGTGGGEALTCDLYGDGSRVAPYLDTMFPLELVRACAHTLSSRADLTQYTTENAARDLDDVRAALGASRVSLFGASYGTRLALVYMRLFPEHVERAALLGVLPPDAPTGSDFAVGGQRALDSAFVACARDAACKRAAPEPRRDVTKLLDQLRRTPAIVTVRNAARGDSERVTLTARAVAEGLFIAAYSPPQLMRLLMTVHRAVASRDLTALTAQFAELSRSKRTGRAVGLALSVWCAEDIPRLASSDTVSRRSLLGIPALPEIMRACGEWPHSTVPASYGAPVTSAVPTLFMSGGRDPATPAYRADSVAKRFSHAELYNDPALGHATLDDRGRDRMARFFERKH